MIDGTSRLCDDGEIASIVECVQDHDERGLDLIEAALASFPQDPRLHYLKGSVLVGTKRFVAAHKAMSRAIAIDPDYHLARFQLGLFELTSGEPQAAFDTWKSLDSLASETWMRLFVDGLHHLVADRFDECVAALRAGIAANQENPPLNADMQLIIDQCASLTGAGREVCPDEELSAASLLLGSVTQRGKH